MQGKLNLKNIKEESWGYIILLLSFIYLFIVSFMSEGLYGDTDSIAHYNLARYAFKYPDHFVHHWGKPLFTTLCAPFAQFGFQGAITFNILCGILSSWFIYRIAKMLNYSNALLVIPFVLFAPIYMVTMMTGQTEILFGLVLVAGIYFFLKQQFTLSAVIISFIPYARTEGLMFLAIFLLAYLLSRKYRAIPFLLTGFIIYSFAGYFHYKDLFWFFTALPYGAEGSKLYGSGSFWFYILNLPKMMGYPVLLFATAGLIIMLIRIFKIKMPFLEPKWIAEYYLLFASFFGYLFIHSFLWWQGMFGVFSSERFMACIMPIGGLFALAGFNRITGYLPAREIYRIIAVTVVLSLVIWMPYHFYDIPAPLVKQDKVMKETADAVRKMGYKDRKVVFFDPKFAFYLGEDPYETSKLYFRLADNKKPETGQPDGTLLIWDAYFAEMEKKLLLEDMVRNPNFKLIDGYIPEVDYRHAGRQNYMSFIFQKKTSEKNQNEWQRVDSMDYETLPSAEKEKFLSDSLAYTGRKSFKLDSRSVYTYAMEKKLSDFHAAGKVIARARAKIFIPGKADPDKIVLVLSVHDQKGNFIRYLTKSASYYNPEPGKWFEMSILSPVLVDYPEDRIVKLYVWFTGKEELFVDDLILEDIPVNH